MRCTREGHREHSEHEAADCAAPPIGFSPFLQPAIAITSIGVTPFFPPDADNVS
jgi:hypothetical protein